MSKFLINICRHQNGPSAELPISETLLSRFVPDHVAHHRPHITCGANGVMLARFGGGAGPKHSGSGHSGTTPPPCPWRVVSDDHGSTEISSDIVGSQSIWYACTDRLFLASSSQRAIVAALGELRLNGQAVLWMLSSGCLGPGHSWDERINRLPADGQLRLDRRAWRVSVEERHATFEPSSTSRREHEAGLREAIVETFKELEFSEHDWVLPLSGGFDSRALLLLFLQNGQRVSCITWGVRTSLNERGSDAFVARRLARHFGLEHRFFELDSSDEPFDSIAQRFLVAGEGRVDHIAGYMDGFRLWQRLCESGVQGVIRGDEGFGWEPVQSPVEVGHSVGLTTFEDFPALKELGLDRFGQQEVPDSLRRREAESLATWRDRLYHAFRIPDILAALNDLKAAYVEIANPFLSRRIITTVRTLPDHLRTDKILFKQIVRSMGPKIPFAKRSATGQIADTFKSPDARETVFDELNSLHARQLLGGTFCDYVLDAASPPASRSSFGSCHAIRQGKRLVPRRARMLLRRKILRRTIPPCRLALRAFLACKMVRLLEEDARLGRECLVLS